MVKHLLRRCTQCGEYSLREDACPRCGGEVRLVAPARFSPDDPLLSKKIEARRYLREQRQRG